MTFPDEVRIGSRVAPDRDEQPRPRARRRQRPARRDRGRRHVDGRQFRLRRGRVAARCPTSCAGRSRPSNPPPAAAGGQPGALNDVRPEGDPGGPDRVRDRRLAALRLPRAATSSPAASSTSTARRRPRGGSSTSSPPRASRGSSSTGSSRAPSTTCPARRPSTSRGRSWRPASLDMLGGREAGRDGVFAPERQPLHLAGRRRHGRAGQVAPASRSSPRAT